MTTLLTGGAGFIGSHMSAFLLEKEHDFVFFECPMCNQIPEILKGKEVIVKDICV